MSSFSTIATITATTKRASITGGVGSGLANHLSAFACLPLMPVDAETRNRPDLKAFHEVKETAVDGSLDIREGDMFVVGGVEYPVRAVEEWPWRGSTRLRVIVEELKR